MRIHQLKKLIKPLAGILAVIIMSVSFSGFSIKVGGAADVVCRIFCFNTMFDMQAGSEEKGIIDRMCQYVYNSFSPLNETLCEAAYRFSGDVSVGDISQKVGDDNFLLASHVIDENDEVTGNIDMVYGDGYHESNSINAMTDSANGQTSKETLSNSVADNATILNTLRTNLDTEYLIKNLYVVDSTTSIKKADFNVKKLLEKNMGIEKNLNTDANPETAGTKQPQILIYHTHGASESFKGSQAGVAEQGIIGVGDRLAQVLADTYGYGVYHDRTAYDMINGKIDRSLAYAKALPALKNILANNPSIEVVIDLHRDGVGAHVHTVTTIDGKPTAKVMLFNGLSRNSKGPIKYLKNNNITDNLAFSLQLKIAAMNMYPDFTKPIYLKGYRYNLHLCPRSLLVELGSQNNTFEEACNAVYPFAHILDSVLTGN